MRKCPGEEILQSYLDGELAGGDAESVRTHVGSCLACSAAAHELQKHSRLVAAALAPEFEAIVPTERLRERIDAAIAGAGIVNPVTAETASSSKFRGWLQSLSDRFTFTPKQAFGYAGLVVVLTFAVVLAIIQRQNSRPTAEIPVVAILEDGTNSPKASVLIPLVEPNAPESGNATVGTNRPRKRTVASPLGRDQMANHVKLLPGERSYLQTIAELDSTINKGNGQMRPAIQAEYERNLAFVDRALAVARTAAKSKPNDPDAAEFMFSAYQSKVDLLNAVADARVYNRQH